MTLLEGKRITKRFGGLAALNDVDFYVNEGEIVGLIGANGAGKTTLFNIIDGIYPPSAGEVNFCGERITGLRPSQICKKGIGRTFQLVKPFGNLSVLTNVMIGRLFGRDGQRDLTAAKEDALKILKFVGLGEKANVPARSLTIADRKRLEVARALGTNPRLLLLDEVLAGLNPTETGEAMKLVEKIRKDMGITIFMIEHVMKALIGLSDRVIVLHYGRKIAEGTAQEIPNNPAVIEAYLGKVTTHAQS